MRFTISQMLSAAALSPSKGVLITPDRTVTMAELDRAATGFANLLRSRGIERGDRVTLWIENGWRWMIAYYGALRVGAAVNPCNVLLTADEVAFIINDCSATVALVGREKGAQLMGRTAARLIIDGEDGETGIDFDKLMQSTADREQPFLEIDGEDTAQIVYTSGTTGRPKGARLSHAAILLNTLSTTFMHGRSSGDVVVSALPCSHVYGNIVMNAAVLGGMTLLLLPRFDERTVLHAIQSHRATMFEGVPTMYLRLLNHPEFGEFDLSSLRVCTVGGQTMPVAQLEEAERRFGCRLLELWGMTELGGLGTTHPHRGPKRLGSIGVPLPLVETRVVDLASGLTDVTPGEIGEFLIRGPLVMQGYFGDQHATAEAIDSDGWLHTGDVVRQDADGYVYLVDRLKEVIVSGGYKVYPAEVERVIAEHPAVAMVAVAAMLDGLKGVVPRAFVVLRADISCAGQDIIDHCRTRLAAYKVPRAVAFCEDLPKTSTGKILRRALADSNA